MAKLKLETAHQVPGRIRMKMRAAKGDPELLRQIKETFAEIPGLKDIEVNAVTGSIVLNYHPDDHHEVHSHLRDRCDPFDHDLHPHPHHAPSSEIDELAQRIEDEAEFLAEHSHSARMVVDFFKSVDREVKVASDNLIDLKIVLAAGVIAVTVLEVGATAATPVWVTIAIFGLNHLVEMHPAPKRASPLQAAAPAQSARAEA